jgi:hypothetical protein
MSRRGTKLDAGRQDGDNFTRNVITLSPDGPGSGWAPPAPPLPAAKPVTVRTLRQHDTDEGMKVAGDVYARATADAAALVAQGLAEIVAS